MRKLKNIETGDIDFIKGIIDSTHKRKGEEHLPKEQTFKGRCHARVDAYEDYIKSYDSAFDIDNLQSLEGTHPVLATSDKEEMKSLYSYSRTDIAKLRKEVLTTKGYANNFCPLCEINLVNTMDHFIPQTGYPLFAVHPRNLIPSCIDCNGHKSDTITDSNGNRKYWNVYQDTPPTENYLYCNVEEVNGMPHIQFYIQQGSIDDETFRLIKNTMDDDGQKMFQVYEMACGRFIVKLKDKVVDYVRKNGSIKNLGECFHAIKTDIEDYFVPNSCEDVVKRALIDSPIFQKCVEDELKNLGVAYYK